METTLTNIKTKYRWLWRFSFFWVMLTFCVSMIPLLGTPEGNIDSANNIQWNSLSGVLFSVFILGPLFLGWLGGPLYLYFCVKLFSVKFNQDAISIQQGVIARRYTEIPYEKIQNVIIERDLWDRILGTSRLIIENYGIGNEGNKVFGILLSSANPYPGRKGYAFIRPGVSGERLFIPGLFPQESEKVKEFLLNKSKKII